MTQSLIPVAQSSIRPAFDSLSLSRAVFTWADSTTQPSSPRRADLIRDKCRDVESFFSGHGLSPLQASPNHVSAWRGELEKAGYATATIYSMISRLSSFYKWLQKDARFGVIQNPVALARPPAPKTYQSESTSALDDEQVKTLLSHVRRKRGLPAKRDYAMLLFYCLTGMRREEIARLTWGNLKLKGDRLTFTTRIKGGTLRTVELNHPLAKRALLDYLQAAGRLDQMKPDSPLWARHDRAAGGREARISSHGFVLGLKKYARECGVGYIHLHQTRHTYARIVADASGSLTETQEALGHRNAATTRVYVQRVGIKPDKHSKSVGDRILK